MDGSNKGGGGSGRKNRGRGPEDRKRGARHRARSKEERELLEIIACLRIVTNYACRDGPIDASDSEDLLQKLLMRLIEGERHIIERFDPGRGSLFGYLRAWAEFRIRDLRRTSRRRLKLKERYGRTRELLEVVEPFAWCRYEERCHQLDTCVAKLTELEQDVFDMVYLRRLDNTQIATFVGVENAKVSRIKNEIKRKLNACMRRLDKKMADGD